MKGSRQRKGGRNLIKQIDEQTVSTLTTGPGQGMEAGLSALLSHWEGGGGGRNRIGAVETYLSLCSLSLGGDRLFTISLDCRPEPV